MRVTGRVVAPQSLRQALSTKAPRGRYVLAAHLRTASAKPRPALGLPAPGKTTLLVLLDRPTSGRVGLRRHKIGFVFQRHNLLPYLTARENVALPAWRASGSRSQALSAADELLDQLGLSSRSTARAGVLSPGEAQRVAVARGLINRPSLILADEPTGSLDSASSVPVLDALFGACRDGAALLAVTHASSVAARAHRIIRLRDGVVQPDDPGSSSAA